MFGNFPHTYQSTLWRKLYIPWSTVGRHYRITFQYMHQNELNTEDTYVEAQEPDWKCIEKLAGRQVLLVVSPLEPGIQWPTNLERKNKVGELRSALYSTFTEPFWLFGGAFLGRHG